MRLGQDMMAGLALGLQQGRAALALPVLGAGGLGGPGKPFQTGPLALDVAGLPAGAGAGTTNIYVTVPASGGPVQVTGGASLSDHARGQMIGEAVKAVVAHLAAAEQRTGPGARPTVSGARR
jgi:hypothetical protein